MQGGALSGAASFLLQIPPDASTAVIADRRPPIVVANTATGASQHLEEVSALRSHGARATSDALTLALRQLPPWPGAQPIIVLYTTAPNAGGETATALGERMRRAHAILAVVTTSPDPKYWSHAATATGGIAVSSGPTPAINAFDELADALRGRYAVTFPRPPTSVTQVNLRFDAAGEHYVVPLVLPPEPGSVASRGPKSHRQMLGGRVPPWYWVPGIAGLLIAIAALGMLSRRRRTVPDNDQVPRAGSPAPRLQSRRSGARVDTDPQAPPLGVRVFDVTQAGGPREVTGSLFEERSVRDAKENAVAADSPPAKRPRPTGRRTREVSRSPQDGEDPDHSR